MVSAHPNLPQITERQELVLRLVVRDYTRTATPVSSRTLVDQYGLRVSSATVRNDLARLEELGLLSHPHTSAGRVPTDAGYRYFIEHLMAEGHLPLTEQRRINHCFHQLGLEMHQWLQLSAAVLSDTVRNAAVVTAPRAPQARLKHVQLVSTYGNSVLMVLVLQDGTVRQQGFVSPQPMQQERLGALSEQVSHKWRGLSADELEALPTADLSALECVMLDRAIAVMAEADRSSDVEAYQEGLRHLLAQPEFTQSSAIGRAMSLLEGDWLTASALPQVRAADGVSVIIGRNPEGLGLGDYGLVLSQYGMKEGLMGALGVLGPVRMHYEQVIPAVRYMSSLLSGLVWSMFGPGENDWAAGRTGADRDHQEGVSDT